MDRCKIYSMQLLRWTFGTDHIQNARERMAQNLQFSYGQFHERRKRPPLASHIIVSADYGGW